MQHAFIPKSIDLEAILAQHPPSFQYHIDGFRFIISTIVAQNLKRKDYLNGDYVPLNSLLLQSRLRDYNHYIAYLRQVGIIEVNDHYWLGKSREYKICDRHYNSNIGIQELTHKGITNSTKKQKVIDAATNKEYEYLIKWFNRNLEIDAERATECLNQLYRQEKKSGDARVHKKYAIRVASVRALQTGVYNISVDDNIKRFHSILTGLKKELRQFITYRGEQLTGVDIKNSQPFISNALFNPDFYQKSRIGKITLYSLSPAKFQQISTSIPSILQILPSYFSNSSSHILVKEHESQCQTALELYCTLTDKGRLYDYIAAQYESLLGKKFNLDVPAEKAVLKAVIFTTLFSDNHFIGQPDAAPKRLFRELFPKVYDIFSLIKKKDKGRLAEILQLIESEVVIRRAAKRIGKEHPNLPIFTIHDSIITLSSHKEIVKGIIKDEFQQGIGLMPNVHFEPWVPT